MTKPFYITRDKVWHVRLTYFGKRITIGYYKNESEAILAHNDAQIRFFGNDARLIHIPA